jgi:hypothetical protein
MVEALAQIAVHEDWTGYYLAPAEKLSRKPVTPSENLIDLLAEIKAIPKLANAS